MAIAWKAACGRFSPKPGSVHRLDMDTSGVMVFARTHQAQRHLGLQFERRHLEKTYVAIVSGSSGHRCGHHRSAADRRLAQPSPAKGLCRNRQTGTHPLAGHSARRRIHTPGTDPETGRSHQLRVHLKSIGHPILGDRFYGDASAAPRLMLHAARLSLRHPDDGATQVFEAPLPF